jgi:DNA invertase Pin-like site-specific DNA recombinase
MPKNVLLYARYSTDRQDEVSIETQVELGTTFNDERGWKLVEVFTDAAISGTSFKSRPGIQALLKRCELRRHRHRALRHTRPHFTRRRT